MDDFHPRLNDVEQLEFSCRHPTIQAAPEEMFSDDLAALKLQLRSMEASLNFLNTSNAQREASRFQKGFAHPAGIVPCPPFALPPGPSYLQLFTSLNTDLQGLDTRVTEVEHILSKLEDRVDGLDTNQFTPLSSNISHVSDHVTRSCGQRAAELPCNSHIQEYSPAWLPQHISQPEYDNVCTSPRQGTGTDATTWVETSASIAFRDREIARLEVILSRMQKDAQDSEEMIDHKNSHIDQLAYRQEGLHAEVADLKQTIRAYNNIFALNRREFECQQSSARNRAARVGDLERQVHELQDTLARTTSNNRRKIDDAVAEMDDELCKLRDFADCKDDVVRQQEDLIARGATIIQERDEIIERLTKELKISGDNCRDQSRERERSSRLLEERMDEIIHLKDALAQASRTSTPMSRVDFATSKGTPIRRNEGLQTPITPTAFNAQPNLRQRSGQWTPQSIGKYARLPHEQRRAAAWNTGPTALVSDKFGQASKISLRQSDSLKLLGKLALVEGEARAQPLVASPSRARCQLPLDALELDRPKSHEMPPTLPSCPSTSHNDDEAGHSPGSTLSRQHCDYKEPTRSLQAYVEDQDTRERRGDAA